MFLSPIVYLYHYLILFIVPIVVPIYVCIYFPIIYLFPYLVPFLFPYSCSYISHLALVCPSYFPMFFVGKEHDFWVPWGTCQVPPIQQPTETRPGA